MIEIYTATYCGYCEKAIELLFKGGYTFKVVDITNDHIRRYALRSKTGCKTVPQIFINEKFIGGCSDLQSLLAKDSMGSLVDSEANEE